MNHTMRELVREGYNKGSYAKTYVRKSGTLEAFEKALIDQLLIRIPKQSKILDLGCGVGLPYDRFFVTQKYDVTGIDISEKHIEQAKKNVKNAQFINGDFFSKEISGRYDAIVSFYAIFHIPRKEHAKLLKHIHSLLKKNGFILITLGAESMVCDVNDDFAGAKMAWSSYSVKKNKKLVEDAGFRILLAVEDVRVEHHLWILAQKKE